MNTPIGCETAVFDEFDYAAGEEPVRWVFVCGAGNGRVAVFDPA